MKNKKEKTKLNQRTGQKFLPKLDIEILVLGGKSRKLPKGFV